MRQAVAARRDGAADVVPVIKTERVAELVHQRVVKIATEQRLVAMRLEPPTSRADPGGIRATQRPRYRWPTARSNVFCALPQLDRPREVERVKPKHSQRFPAQVFLDIGKRAGEAVQQRKIEGLPRGGT